MASLSKEWCSCARVRFLSRLGFLAVAGFALEASAQSQQVVQKFVAPLNFAAPIVGSIGALAVIGGILAKGAGQQQGGNMALAAGVVVDTARQELPTFAYQLSAFGPDRQHSAERPNEEAIPRACRNSRVSCPRCEGLLFPASRPGLCAGDNS